MTDEGQGSSGESRRVAEYEARIASLVAEIAQVRYHNTNLLAANVRLERRVLDKSDALWRLIEAQEPAAREVDGSIFCGFEKGEPIQKTGGDYDADAQFVCAFEWQGLVRFVGAIPQKRGCLFYIFHPRQVTPRVRLPPPDPPPAPRRFRHRKRGSTYALVGEAEMLLTRAVSDDATLTVCRRKSDNRLVARPVSEPGPDEQLHNLIGFAVLQSERKLGRDGDCHLLNLTVYRCEDDGKLWARTTAEFNDGRFEELPPAPGANA